MCAGHCPRLAGTTRPRDSCCAAHGVLLSGWVQHMGSEIQGTAASCSVAGPVGGTLHVITNLSRSSAPSRGISRCPASVPGPEWGSFVAFGAMMVDVPLMTSLLDEVQPCLDRKFQEPISQAIWNPKSPFRCEWSAASSLDHRRIRSVHPAYTHIVKIV